MVPFAFDTIGNLDCDAIELGRVEKVADLQILGGIGGFVFKRIGCMIQRGAGNSCSASL